MLIQTCRVVVRVHSGRVADRSFGLLKFSKHIRLDTLHSLPKIETTLQHFTPLAW
jgi:hypothetical protein